MEEIGIGPYNDTPRRTVTREDRNGGGGRLEAALKDLTTSVYPAGATEDPQ